jgi:hypothetical protein
MLDDALAGAKKLTLQVRRWLKPGGAMLPDFATMYIAAADASALDLGFWDAVYGFSYAPVAAELHAAAQVPGSSPAWPAVGEYAGIQLQGVLPVKGMDWRESNDWLHHPSRGLWAAAQVLRSRCGWGARRKRRMWALWMLRQS